MSTSDSLILLLTAARACDEKKAEDIRILRLDPSESGLTDYFLICNGTNSRQNDAISDEIEIQIKRQFGVYPNSVEGRRTGEWILLDYVDFIVHIFSAEKRDFYGLERLRKSATVLTLADLEAEVAPKPKKAAPQKPVEKKPVATKVAAKPVAKKSAGGKLPTKTAAKSIPAKSPSKPVAKKAAVKKVLPKKSVAKKATAKKPATKAIAKKAAAKKPATKAIAKKSASKPAKKTAKKKSTKR